MSQIERQPVSVLNWVFTFILTSLPIVGFVLLLVWALGGTAYPSKANYARAVILLLIIGVVIYFLLVVTLGLTFAGLSQYRRF